MGSPNTDITVIGAGGHAKVVIAALRAAGHRVAALFDDDRRLWGQLRCGVRIRGPISQLHQARGLRAILAIGDNTVRRHLTRRLDLAWFSVVHPHAWVDGSVRLEPGVVVCAGAVIQPDCVVGAHTIVNTSASADHDSVIGPFSHLAPGVHLAGGVRIGAGVFLGTGSVVIPGVAIGADTVVGAGSVVLDDLPAGVVAYGSPATARRIGHDNQGFRRTA